MKKHEKHWEDWTKLQLLDSGRLTQNKITTAIITTPSEREKSLQTWGDLAQKTLFAHNQKQF